MKTKTYSSLGLEVVFTVPESVEEFDTNAKRAGACLDEATNNVIYRGSLAEFREQFCERLASETDIARFSKPLLDKENKPRKDAEGNELITYTESEADFVKRVCAEKGVEVTAFQTIATAIGAGITFDASARERVSRLPVKLKAEYLNTADRILQSGDFSKVNAAFAQYNIPLPTLSGDATKDRDVLGRSIKALQEARAKDALNNL